MKSPVDPGERTDELELHLESNESIEQDEDKEFQVKLQHQLRKALSEPSLQQQLIDLVKKGQISGPDAEEHCATTTHCCFG